MNINNLRLVCKSNFIQLEKIKNNQFFLVISSADQFNDNRTTYNYVMKDKKCLYYKPSKVSFSIDKYVTLEMKITNGGCNEFFR